MAVYMCIFYIEVHLWYTVYPRCIEYSTSINLFKFHVRFIEISFASTNLPHPPLVFWSIRCVLIPLKLMVPRIVPLKLLWVGAADLSESPAKTRSCMDQRVWCAQREKPWTWLGISLGKKTGRKPNGMWQCVLLAHKLTKDGNTKTGSLLWTDLVCHFQVSYSALVHMYLAW